MRKEGTMTESEEKTKAQPINDREKSRLRRYIWLLVIFWTAGICVSLFWNLFQLKRGTEKMALTQARESFQKDILLRRWNSKYGGVYVPITEKSQPNPYLKVPERDIRTLSGRSLTLINPAYMTRQVYELQDMESGIKGHITSLNPIRPDNAADPWETEALKAFEQGETEVSSLFQLDDVKYLRLMRPLITEESCLKCHSVQGYRVGDIRGGISISVPMAPLRAIEQYHAIVVILGHSIIWLLGLLGIGMGVWRISRDITERKKAENELKKYRDHLEELVEERTRDLKQKQSELNQSQRLAATGRLSASIAHEINNPLQAISSGLGYVEGFLPDDFPAKNSIKTIKNGLNRIANTVRQLLDLHRPKAEVKKKVDVNETIDSTLDLTKHQLRKHRISVKKNFCANNPKIYAYAQELFQIFLNLILNAQEAMGETGIISITTEVIDNKVKIAFADNGSGISEKDIDHIFDPFYTTKSQKLGTGLGLSTAKGIVESFGGEISVKSKINKGTTFTVTFPFTT